LPTLPRVTRPGDGRSPTTEQWLPGPRSEPPWSLPCASQTSPVATDTAPPPVEPPEDLREIVGTYHRAVADTVGRFAGFAAKYVGDGVLIYFGYPQAHEDDAERAVRAGLAVIGGGRASRCSRNPWRCGWASPAGSSAAAT
jgi:hypothetical protein